MTQALERQTEEDLGWLMSHPLRVKVLLVLIERAASPAEIRKFVGGKLSDVSYQVKELRKRKFIELIKEERRRGQTAHIYRAVRRPITSNEEWAKLSQKEREQHVLWAVRLILVDVVSALKGGVLQARSEAHTSRGLFRVDEQGWQEINALHDLTLRTSFKIEEESQERLRESGEDGIPIRTAQLCFEVPPAPEHRPNSID